METVVRFPGLAALTEGSATSSKPSSGWLRLFFVPLGLPRPRLWPSSESAKDLNLDRISCGGADGGRAVKCAFCDCLNLHRFITCVAGASSAVDRLNLHRFITCVAGASSSLTTGPSKGSCCLFFECGAAGLRGSRVSRGSFEGRDEDGPCSRGSFEGRDEDGPCSRGSFEGRDEDGPCSRGSFEGRDEDGPDSILVLVTVFHPLEWHSEAMIFAWQVVEAKLFPARSSF